MVDAAGLDDLQNVPPRMDTIVTQVGDFLIDAMNQHVLPGLGVGIIRGGKLIYAKGFGFANVATDTAVTPDTVFRIGSISKTFTAVGIMQLWEQGQFDLDDPVNDYLKSFQIKAPHSGAPPVTFRHLLTHTSGIGAVRTLTDLVRPNAGLAARPDQRVPDLQRYYAGGLRAEVDAGTKWSYNNHAFATLGQVIEDIGGEPFPEYMKRHVFGPLGMSHTDYLLSERVRAQLAQGYSFERSRLVPIEYQAIVTHGAGSIFSTVNDMVLYVIALLRGGQTEHGMLLKPETLQRMLQPEYRPDPHLPGMGLAFIVEEWDGHRIAWHNGGWPGFSSEMFVAPDDDLGIVLFTNALDFAFGDVARGLLRRLLDVPAPATQLPRPGILETPSLWPDLTGFYGPLRGWSTNLQVWSSSGGELEVVVKGNRLALRSLFGGLRQGVTLYRADHGNPLVFQARHDQEVQTVVFFRDEAGKVSGLHVGLQTLYKHPLTQSLRVRLVTGLGAVAGVGLALAASRLRKRSNARESRRYR